MPCNCATKKEKKATLRDPDTGTYVENVDKTVQPKAKRKTALSLAMIRDRRYAASGMATKELYYVLLGKKR